MNDLLTALALVLVIEGVLYALLPGLMRKGVLMMLSVPESQLRITGLVLAVLGVWGVWMIRGG